MADTEIDDSRIDLKLDQLEDELDIMEESGRELMRRLSDVCTPRNRSRGQEEVDHASLMTRLVSRIKDPTRIGSPNIIPHQSIERFVRESVDRAYTRPTQLLTDGLPLPEFGIEHIPRRRHDLPAISRSPQPALAVERSDDDSILRPMRNLETFAKTQLELELSMERHNRKSSEGFAKDLLRTLRGLESQLVQQVKLSEVDKRMFEREIEGMRSNVEKLELERQSLLDVVEKEYVREASSVKSIRLLHGDINALEQRNSKLVSDLMSSRQEAEILKASIVDLETSRSQMAKEILNLKNQLQSRSTMEKEVLVLRNQQQIHPRPGSISPVPSLPPFSNHEGVEAIHARPRVVDPQRVDSNSLAASRKAVERYKGPHNSHLTPYSDHEGINLDSVSPKSVEPQRVKREALVAVQNVRPVRSAVMVAPYSDHEGIELTKSPRAIAPQRMSLSDLISATAQQTRHRPQSVDDPDRMTPSFVDIQEENVQTPPTPTTPKPRADSPSPRPRVDTATVEKELLELNLERQELESWLSRFPPNTAGRTLAERKEKYLHEKRLAEVEKGISEKRLILKHARIGRIDPTHN